MTTDHAVEDPQSLRMMAVLQESVRKTGVRATADWLGVDRRTVLVPFVPEPGRTYASEDCG